MSPRWPAHRASTQRERKQHVTQRTDRELGGRNCARRERFLRAGRLSADERRGPPQRPRAEGALSLPPAPPSSSLLLLPPPSPPSLQAPSSPSLLVRVRQLSTPSQRSTEPVPRSVSPCNRLSLCQSLPLHRPPRLEPPFVFPRVNSALSKLFDKA